MAPGVPEVPCLGIPDLLPDIDLPRALGLHTSVIYTIKDVVLLLAAFSDFFIFSQWTPVVIAGYDQLLIPKLGVWIIRQSSGGGFAAFDVRALNSFYFGLALYLTVLFRVRRRSQSAQSIGDRLYEWRRLRGIRAQSLE